MNYDIDLEKRFRNTQFLTSAATLNQCPVSTRVEIAFVGRSNVGKSSVLNCLCQQKRLAKTSKTPGRTQLINFFQADDELQLIDLPGYGYAKVSRTQQQAWAAEVTKFLKGRESLTGLILIMDIRHPLKPIDETLLKLAGEISLPVHILLNKADKLSRNQANTATMKLNKELKKWAKAQPKGSLANITVQPFSAEKREGLDVFYEHIQAQWIQPAPMESIDED